MNHGFNSAALYAALIMASLRGGGVRRGGGRQHSQKPQKPELTEIQLWNKAVEERKAKKKRGAA
jgi:hypothetical protein